VDDAVVRTWPSVGMEVRGVWLWPKG
jgi:hypothetical protein